MSTHNKGFYEELKIISNMEPRREKTGFLHMRKTETQISFAVTAKLISAFVFRYMDSTIPFLPKYKISSL